MPVSEKETKVKINGEDFYLINFPVGDWQKQGHELCDYYIIKSKKPVKDIREAHFKAEESIGFYLEDICSEKEEYSLDDKVTAKLKQLGYNFDLFEDFEDDGRPSSLNSEHILDIWIFFLNSIDSSLKLEKLNPQNLHYKGKDDKKREFKTPGYGVLV